MWLSKGIQCPALPSYHIGEVKRKQLTPKMFLVLF